MNFKQRVLIPILVGGIVFVIFGIFSPVAGVGCGLGVAVFIMFILWWKRREELSIEDEYIKKALPAVLDKVEKEQEEPIKNLEKETQEEKVNDQIRSRREISVGKHRRERRIKGGVLQKQEQEETNRP
ncbi:unnamed protein product [marine sediment metagenome]|uniref:Uncharacterized protein n=1 Tax=marine sediment metagenome TaxID=412755 RepID=X1CD72_9ZZZZ